MLRDEANKFEAPRMPDMNLIGRKEHPVSENGYPIDNAIPDFMQRPQFVVV